MCSISHRREFSHPRCPMTLRLLCANLRYYQGTILAWAIIACFVAMAVSLMAGTTIGLLDFVLTGSRDLPWPFWWGLVPLLLMVALVLIGSIRGLDFETKLGDALIMEIDGRLAEAEA